VTPLVYALVSHVGWGVGDIFATIVTRKIGGFSSTFWSLVFRLILFGFYAPFVFQYLTDVTLGLIFVILLLGAIFIIGVVAFSEGLRVGNAALVGTIAAAFPFVSVFLAIVFLGESLTLQQYLAVGVIFVGLLLSGLNLKQLKLPLSLDKGVWLGLAAMVSWGIYFGFIKIPVQRIGWFWPNYIVYAMFPFLLLFMRMRKIRLVMPTYKRAFSPMIVSVVLLSAADFSYNKAISAGSAAVVAPIAGSYPALFVVLAFLVFKDPITKQQLAGIITTLAGIILLSVFTGFG